MSKFTAKSELIAQMLAKAESTTPEEAEALTAAAERLMVKHGIDAAVIAARRAAAGKDAEPEQVVTRTVEFTGMFSMGLAVMAKHVIDAFGTMRCYVQGYRRTSDLTFYIVGFESDADQAQLLVQSLHMQAVAAMATWWKNYPLRTCMSRSEAKNTRRQFLISFGEGAAERIKSETARVADAADATAPGGTGTTAIALRDRRAEVSKHMPDTRTSRLRAGGTTASASAGRTAGRNANVGTRAVDGTRAALTA